MLVQENIISERMLEEALNAQKRNGGKIVEVLIQLGYLTINDFVDFLSRQPGVASIDLAHYQIPQEIIDLVPKEVVLEHEIFPIDKMGKLLTLGMVCPLDSKTISKIESDTGLRVKPILCSPDDIRGAIRRYYGDTDFKAYDKAPPSKTDEQAAPEQAGQAAEGDVTPSKVETGLKLGNVVRMIQELQSLPALPDTVSAVQEAMQDKNSSATDVAQRIIMDPPIAAKVLSVANSPAYGFPNQVDSVDLAVALLGLRETYSIVLSAAVMNLFETNKTFNYKLYWEESMNVAAASQLLAKARGRGGSKVFFTAGLLHDVGRIALLETEPDKYKNVGGELMGDELIAAEQETVGLSHTEAGFELASNWALPEEISEAIRFHHAPEYAKAHPVITNIVATAQHWMRYMSLGDFDKNELIKSTNEYTKVIDLDSSAASAVFDEVAELERVRFTWEGSESA